MIEGGPCNTVPVTPEKAGAFMLRPLTIQSKLLVFLLLKAHSKGCFP